MNFLCRKRRIINGARQWLGMGASHEKMIVPFKKLQALLKLEVRGTKPPLCPLHFRGESEEEPNSAAPLVKATSGRKRKHLRMHDGLKGNQANAERKGGKSFLKK